MRSDTHGETNEWPLKLKNAEDRKAVYHEYLASEAWQDKRAGALKRAGNRCQVCNRNSRLRVHHRTYERVGQEAPDDLTVLCEPCHSLFHGVLKITRAGKPGKRGKYSARHKPCTRCGNYTTKGLCKPCRNGKEPKKKRSPVTQADINRFAGAMSRKWKPTTRRERMQASLAESKRTGAVQGKSKPSLRNMRPSGARGAS